jgi:hypothetical protein
MTKEMEDDIKAFWHDRRLDSKGAAVRHLIQDWMSRTSAARGSCAMDWSTSGHEQHG